MTIQIIDNEIVSNLKAVMSISGVNNTIEVIANSPVESTVFLKLEGFKNPILIPLYFAGTSENGNKFVNKIVFLNEQVEYIKNNPTQVYTGTFMINGCHIVGDFYATVNPQHVRYLSKVDTSNAELIKEVIKLRSELRNLQVNYPQLELKNVTDLRKGTVPTATGVGNEFIWDYPLANVYNKLKELTEIVVSLTEQNKNLTKEVGELKEQFLDHVYEEYDL